MYIESLKKADVKLTRYSRKCGFQGFIICLKNVFELFDVLQEKYEFKYLLTYKLLQDMIENLFSAIRMMGGFSNNPTPYQFQTAIRRLVIHHEVVYSDASNCSGDDQVMYILRVGSSKKKEGAVASPDNEDGDDYENGFELFKFQNVQLPRTFIRYAVLYISGYIVFKLITSRTNHFCIDCFNYVTSAPEPSLLTDEKNRGPLKYASSCVVSLCMYLESVLRENEKDLLKRSFFKTCLQYVSKQPETYFKGSHFESTSHGAALIRYIAKLYLTIRLHHEEKISNNVEKYVRKLNSKLTIFMHQ